MGRAPCCDKSKVKKGPWSPDEDAKLKSHIQNHGTGGNWIALPTKIGLKRCGKSCRLRWLNYLRPNLKHGGFTAEEDNLICSLYVAIGSRWSVIAAQLPGRTDNDIKNYWNTRLKKKLFSKQRRSAVAAAAAAAKSLPPPPQPLLADHAPIDVEQINSSYFNNFEADFRCAWENSGVMNPLPPQPEMYGAMPQLDSAAVTSSAAIWEEMNCMSYYNPQLFDERLLGYSQ